MRPSPQAEGEYRALTRYFQDRYTILYRNGLHLTPDMIAIDHAAKHATSQNRFSHTMIIVGFPTDFRDFDVVHKIVRKKWLHEWVIRWEFGEHGNHPHLNILCRKNKPFSQVVREFASTCKVEPNFVDVKFIRQKDYKQTFHYLINKTKHQDNEQRKKFGLPPYELFSDYNLENLENSIQKFEKILSNLDIKENAEEKNIP